MIVLSVVLAKHLAYAREIRDGSCHRLLSWHSFFASDDNIAAVVCLSGDGSMT